MPDTLLKGLEEAGVPSVAAFKAVSGMNADQASVRVLIAADRDAVLRVLLEARLAEVGGALHGCIMDFGPDVIGISGDRLLDLLAPSVPRV